MKYPLRKTLANIMVVAAMLIAFIGQAMAYASMSCEMMTEQHNNHLSMDHNSLDHASMDHHEGMNHQSMEQGNMQHNSSDMEDCCDSNCVCPANACSSVPCLNAYSDSGTLFNSAELIVNRNTEQLSSRPTSLFRPPIFA